jgi:nucleoside-diphosphate kinase
MERTFAIIKPDAFANKNVGKVMSMIESDGFHIVAMEKIIMNDQQAQALYHDLREKSFFGELVSAMTSSPVIILCLEKDNAVKSWRDLMGATNPKEAEQGTIRALFSEHIGANTVHGSDSLTNAARELAIFFPGL